MWLPKLEYDDTSYSETECKRLRCFLDRNLPLHKAPVIESLRLKFSKLQFKPKDVKLWIVIAVSRYVRELEISYSFDRNNLNILPSSLYTCKSLVVLKLNGNILLDVPRMVCLPSLKTLQLRDVIYHREESLQRLLSICPILEDLLVRFWFAKLDDMTKFSIIAPSLHSLTLYIPDYFYIDGFVINTPSLKYFKLKGEWENIHSCLIENMPKLREAYVDVADLFYMMNLIRPITFLKSLIRSITSVNSLTLCVRFSCLKDSCYDGLVFNQLEHLKLCVCQDFNVHVWFLRHCPNLTDLDFFGTDGHCYDGEFLWNEPTIVPECILSNLQNLKWSKYFGRQADRDFAIYILEKARCLKTATFLSDDCCVPKLEMIKELAFSSRASTMCQLTFD